MDINNALPNLVETITMNIDFTRAMLLRKVDPEKLSTWKLECERTCGDHLPLYREMHSSELQRIFP
jgi:hypothetical protein